jgi:hypothetical protein
MRKGGNFGCEYALIERLKSEELLRRIVGDPRKLPSHATLSRAFHEFPRTYLAGQIHEALKSRVLDPGAIVIDSSLDVTAIEGREKAAKKAAPAPSPTLSVFDSSTSDLIRRPQ